MTASHDLDNVLLVPLIDVNWLVYAPFDPARDFRVDPPKVEQSVGETRQICRLLRDLTGGKYILTPHSGTYCRTGYYEGEMLDVYKQVAADGGELCIHLHEEIKGAGTRYADQDHVTAVFVDCKRRLESAGITPVAYRGGHYAYAPFMNDLLSLNGIFVDCSCSPGADQPGREAVWIHAETSGHYLPENPRLPATGQRRSKVFEIPIGCDGLGSAYREHPSTSSNRSSRTSSVSGVHFASGRGWEVDRKSFIPSSTQVPSARKSGSSALSVSWTSCRETVVPL